MAFKYNPFSGTLDMTLSGYTYLIGTTNPNVIPGVKAQIGLLYNNNTTGILWHKFGINDTDWAAITSLPYGLAELNLQTGLSQTLVTGTTGTDFNIVSATDIHTFNLPTATSVNTGKLAAGDFTNFNNTNTCMGMFGAADLGSFTGTIIGSNKTVKQALQSLETTEDHLITLSGVAKNSNNLGTFTGTIIPIDQTIKASIQAVSTTEDNLITLTGVAKDAVNLGTFPSGVIIPDSSTIKDALAILDQTQSNLVSLSGVTKDSINFGSFTGTNIPANQDTKQALQALSTAIDGKQATLTLPLSIANGGTNSSSALTGSKVIVSDSTSIKESTITTTTLAFLDATSSIQSQLNGKQPSGSYEVTSNKSTTVTLGTSDSLYPSQKAVKSYIDQRWIDINRNGFLNQTETSISFNDVTYTFTLTDAGSGWSYYRSGLKYTISGNKTIVLPGTPPTARIYYIYIDAIDGTLTQSTTPWTLSDTKIPVAIISWNNSNTPKYILMEERHTCLIDTMVHLYEHSTEGTKASVVGNLTGYTLNSDVDANKTFAISQSTIFDEDIQMILAPLVQPNGTNADYDVAYRTSLTTWSWKQSNMPFVYNVGNANNWIQYDNAGTMTDGIAARWFNSYLILSNALTTNTRFLIVPGRALFTSLALAQAEDFASFDVTGLPISEGVAVYQLTWSTVASTSQGKCRLIVAPKKISVNIVQTTGAVAGTDHNTLSNLQGGTAGERYHLTLSEHTLASQMVNYVGTEAIPETTFSIANNQSSAANVTGFLFTNGVTRCFEARAFITINATTPIYEELKLYGIQKASTWDLTVTSIGDNSGISFVITNAGQLEYYSPNFAGFVSGTMKFNAYTNNV